MLFHSRHPWIIKMKKCANEYKLNKQSKQTKQSNMSGMTKGMKQFHKKVNEIEKKIKIAEKKSNNKQLIRRIRGSRY